MPVKDKARKLEYQRAYYRRTPEQRLKAVQRVKERRAEIRQLVNDYKLQKGCIDCGYNSHVEALDFDHLRDKMFNVSHLVRRGWSWENIMGEIQKCEVVCANCHRVRTANRR